jgi:putative restriction endonuclease
MTTPLSLVTASRLEKAASDNGFDRELGREGDWLGFASIQCPLRLWLGTFGDGVLAEGTLGYLPWHWESVFRQ